MADAQFTGGAVRSLTAGNDARVSGGAVRSLTAGNDARVSGGAVRALYNFPSVEMRASGFQVRAFNAGTAPDAYVSHMRVRALVRGRVENPAVRAWTYTLDGHDFYVLRLGNFETLVYDFHTEQWYVYGSHDSDIWRAYTGINWQGGNYLSQNHGTNVLVGDDGNGALYFLNAEESYDDDAIQGSLLPREFPREVYGQVATRAIDAVPCYGVQLMGSIGEMSEAALTAVTLYTSDDQGHTYDDQGTITIPNADYNARVEWWSLGQITAPGRLFRISDTGALHRIDYLEMIEPPEEN